MANDDHIVEARGTFHGFVNLIKYGTIFSAIVALIVILLIAPK